MCKIIRKYLLCSPSKEERNAATKEQRCRKRLPGLTSTEHASILVKTTRVPWTPKPNDVHAMPDRKSMKRCGAQLAAALVDICVFCVTHGLGFPRNLKVVSGRMGDVCLANGGICKVVLALFALPWLDASLD